MSTPRFARIFTKEEEINLLKSFSTLSHPNKISAAKVQPFRLSSGSKFSDVQLTDKLRKLRRKFHKMDMSRVRMARSRGGYDWEVYQISRNLWGQNGTLSDANEDGVDQYENTDDAIGGNENREDGAEENENGDHGFGGNENREDGIEENENGDHGFGGNGGLVGFDEVGNENGEDGIGENGGLVGLDEVGDGSGHNGTGENGGLMGLDELGNEDGDVGWLDVSDAETDGLEVDGRDEVEVPSEEQDAMETDGSNGSENDGRGSKDRLEIDSQDEVEVASEEVDGSNGSENDGRGSLRGKVSVPENDGRGSLRRKVNIPENVNHENGLGARNMNVTRPTLFQRIFTEKDEINLLKWFSKFAKSNSRAKITTAIVGRFKKSLGPRFSDTQLSAKLRKLRQKYHKMARSKSRIKSDHDRKVYEISRMIWGKNEMSREADGDGEDEELSTQDNDEVDGQDDGDHAEINDQSGLRRLNVSNTDVSNADSDRDDGLRDAEMNGLTGLNVPDIDSRGGSRTSVPEVDGMNEMTELNNAEMVNGSDGLKGVNGKENVNNKDEVRAMNVNASNEVDGAGLNVNVRSEVDVNKYPFLLKEFTRCLPENPVWKEGFKEMSEEKLRVWNEEWKKLQIEEARIMAKRAGMIQEQMKELLEFV